MDFSDADANPLTRKEIAWQLAELFDELEVEQLNEILTKNVPLEMLEFFSAYVDDFCDARALDLATRRGLPNLLVLGYLLRILEERLLQTPEFFDA
jgi:hypothetical protein